MLIRWKLVLSEQHISFYVPWPRPECLLWTHWSPGKLTSPGLGACTSGGLFFLGRSSGKRTEESFSLQTRHFVDIFVYTPVPLYKCCCYIWPLNNLRWTAEAQTVQSDRLTRHDCSHYTFRPTPSDQLHTRVCFFLKRKKLKFVCVTMLTRENAPVSLHHLCQLLGHNVQNKRR